MIARDLVTHLDHFQHRVVQDAMVDADARYWQRRADAFEAVRPQPGDYIGTAGQKRADEIEQAAVASRDACLARARVSVLGAVA